MEESKRKKMIDELTDALAHMFGGGIDGVVYAKAIEREKVRRLLHELLSLENLHA